MEIRPAATHEELYACVDLQVKVWGFTPYDAVPFNQLHAAHAWGGQVLVAVDDGQVAGFCYGFGGRQYGRPALCSHMLGVLPAYRGQDLGVALKLAQGRWARENGYDLITWTFDPLEAVNASLNIARLGGVVRQYLVNHYGDMQDGLNKGLPTDRLLVEWHLTDPRVERVLAGERLPSVVQAPGTVAVAVPRQFQAIKQADPPEALRWRLTVREQMTGPLGQGYLVTGFRTESESGVYLLTREDEASAH